MQQLLMDPTRTQVSMLESHKTLKSFNPNSIEPNQCPIGRENDSHEDHHSQA